MLALAGLALGCGGSREQGLEVRRSFEPVNFRVVGGEQAEVELLREIAARTNSSGLEAVGFEDAPDDVGVFSAHGTRWLRFEYASVGEGYASIEPFWRSGLIAVAYRRAAIARDLPLPRGWSVAEAGTEGERNGNSVQISEEPFVSATEQPELDVDELVERLRNERSETLRILSLELTQPSGFAAAIVAETTDPVGFFCNQSDALSHLMAPLSGDGHLIRIVDTRGELVWTTGVVSGAGVSISWAMPGFQGEEYSLCKG